MHTPVKKGIRVALVVLLLVALYYLSPALWLGFLLSRTQAAWARAEWPGTAEGVFVRVERVDEDGRARQIATGTIVDRPDGVRGAFVRAEGRMFRLLLDDTFRMDVGDQTTFVVPDPVFEDTGNAWKALFSKPVMPPVPYRWAAVFALRPRWDGWERTETGRQVRIQIPGGRLYGTLSGRWGGGVWEGRIGGRRWRIEVRPEPDAEKTVQAWQNDSLEREEIEVGAREMDHGMAAVFRLLALQTQPVPREKDGDFSSGKGSVTIRNGMRILSIAGTPYEMGRQQGVLLRESVRRGIDRVVYGVGLIYSITEERWFFDTVREVIERQKPYIEDRFFEEMRGVAEGAGVTVEEILIANFFPELWHCSGIALYDSATADGQLLHARVLDYITVAGLQDEAVLIAAQPEGRARFVNIGYSGFVGSVTGMNEHGVAIGEMGGSGYGKWDGTPMSLLIRGALEESETLDETLQYFRNRRRTCEYYYVFSDGKTRQAVGVCATPEQLDVIQPGEKHPTFSDPVPDTILISGGRRYRHLVRRVREQYGTITAERLVEILRRPVSMKSNLHNVIFEPETLALHVAHAGRRSPACDQTYHRYAWEDLFPANP